MYVAESSDFWLRVLLLLTIIFLSSFLFNTMTRKLFHVERKRIFSYNYVNEKHMKIDWILRIPFLFLMFAGFVINVSNDFTHWFLQPFIFLFLLIFASEITRVIMERKYAENPNAYKVTLSQLIFTLILLSALYMTNFFGLI
ncbi:DUF4181 domain-containing protein [Terribacillus saccharophilus]|uniref:DUF4181 domain-containing protein n=1 Tax=Terribacillus saccharophilus TaxID=361277 RepID=UPI0039829787